MYPTGTTVYPLHRLWLRAVGGEEEEMLSAARLTTPPTAAAVRPTLTSVRARARDSIPG